MYSTSSEEQCMLLSTPNSGRIHSTVRPRSLLASQQLAQGQQLLQHSRPKASPADAAKGACSKRRPWVQDRAQARQEKRLQDMPPLSWQGPAQEAFP
ncbi:hypothetical protein COCOBI_04-7070 [Coccomyxa sp. Obi]|nr:hypothetical protein COCOBI_04-7070 [Coccomyxa sp. Obi]